VEISVTSLTSLTGRPFSENPQRGTALSGARRANVTGLGAWEPRVEELALPISAESGNLGLNKAVIRWMSGNANRT
jgi:hypothetical protein